MSSWSLYYFFILSPYSSVFLLYAYSTIIIARFPVLRNHLHDRITGIMIMNSMNSYVFNDEDQEPYDFIGSLSTVIVKIRNPVRIYSISFSSPSLSARVLDFLLLVALFVLRAPALDFRASALQGFGSSGPRLTAPMAGAWEQAHVLVAIALYREPSATMGNVCRSWRTGVQAAAEQLGDQLSRCEFHMECLTDWCRHSVENIDQRVDRTRRNLELYHLDPNELSLWWYRLAICMHGVRTRESRRVTLENLLERAVSHTELRHFRCAVFRHYYRRLFQAVCDVSRFQMPMEMHLVRDVNCPALGKSIDEVLWSAVLCLEYAGTRASYCPNFCGCGLDGAARARRQQAARFGIWQYGNGYGRTGRIL